MFLILISFVSSRVLTALCQLKGNLGCARTVCFDVIRTLYGSQNAALELLVTIVTVWPEVLKTSSDCSRGKQSPLAQTLKLLLLYWAQTSPLADLGKILRVLCCWEDDLVPEDVLRRFGSQLIQLLREEGVGANVVLGKGETRFVKNFPTHINPVQSNEQYNKTLFSGYHLNARWGVIEGFKLRPALFVIRNSVNWKYCSIAFI